jgi:hypothetical protein
MLVKGEFMLLSVIIFFIFMVIKYYFKPAYCVLELFIVASVVCSFIPCLVLSNAFYKTFSRFS